MIGDWIDEYMDGRMYDIMHACTLVQLDTDHWKSRVEFD